ncbi:hypothetical protein [Spirilliplanes yamanashiensis]|uniref:Uncharacterized protein n=1 Tax=Spirilliplanes yamanashiensis TaxID=42233 RepID=A0A8J4DKF1_9ACTN|nr:hypothetical protein [Spirilliplanes yamanashiensis]MDP9815736.1 hypothetical protein [Spirilliplanes yamanashiensis]GIJ03990.1 hypothetical protein Sya03_33420 [Spirilliplanes yamanashiensis]
MRATPLLIAGAAAVCVATAVTGAVAASAAEKGGAPAPVPAAARSAAPPSAPPGQPGEYEPPAADPKGDVIDAGFGDWAFWAEPVDIDQPGITFGIMAGTRKGSALTPVVMANETDGDDTAPGFHAVQGGMVVGDDNAATPAFGYYAGPAATITARGKGGTVTAKQAVWSEDSTVVVFWFDPAEVGRNFMPKDLTAFDAAGAKLPTGDNAPGVG